jgi:hypothetical protein
VLQVTLPEWLAVIAGGWMMFCVTTTCFTEEQPLAGLLTVKV